MIVSHQHKFIFLAIPKTGTHAIRYALRPVLAEDDWEQVDLFTKKRIPIESMARIEHGHITALEAKQYLPNEIWDSYFKFALVRNPYDRFVSSCFFLYRKNKAFNFNPIAFMKLLFQKAETFEKLHFLPQTHFICDKEGKLLVNNIGRLEALDEDFSSICEHLKIKPDSIQKRNASDHQHWSVYLDDELKTLVQKTYKSDFETFGYALD